MSELFPRLFETSVLGGMRLKNRIMKAPQHMGLANPDGSVTEGMLQYYKRVALGGAGMVIVEYAWIDKDASKASPCQLGVADYEHIAGLSRLAGTIQSAGAKAGLQISHGEGRSSSAGSRSRRPRGFPGKSFTISRAVLHPTK